MKYNFTIDDYIGGYPSNAKNIASQLKSLDGSAAHVKVSSLGGSVMDALDIRRQFVEHGDVTVYLMGGVASAATILALGAKTIKMESNSFFLVHKCLSYVDAFGYYNADDLEQIISDMQASQEQNEKIDSVIANLYANKCGKSIDEILDVLKKGQWLSAQEALEYGFVDELFGDETTVINSVSPQVLNSLGLPDMPKCERPVVDTSFPALNVVLNVSGLPVQDESIILSSSQVELIEQHVQSLQTSLSDSEAQSRDLQMQVDSLLAAPGAESPEIRNIATDVEVSSHERVSLIFKSI